MIPIELVWYVVYWGQFSNFRFHNKQEVSYVKRNLGMLYSFKIIWFLYSLGRQQEERQI
jgi:hypothetical protein